MAFIVADRVKETSTTTGTGALTLAGAMTGHRAFSTKLAVGDTCYYAIQAVDAAGSPTGEWECGLGTYSGADTLTRTTVTSSSNSDAAVSFAAGTKQVFVTMPAAHVAWVRERLAADRTYYVRTDGSDSNNGLANTSGGAFLTIQKAVDIAAGSIDAAVYQVTVQIADGTYTGLVVARKMLGTLPLTIQGNVTTPANVFVNVTGSAFTVDGPDLYLVVRDMKIAATTYGLSANSGGKIDYQNIDFGACSRHINAQNYGTVVCTGNYAISGAATSHIGAVCGMVQVAAKTVTITGTPNFSVAYAVVGRMGLLISFSNTYSGSANGTRYSISGNSILDANGGATTLLPGNATGTTATGGQYV